MNKKIVQEFLITKSQSGQRLDIFLSEKMEISRSKAQKNVKNGLVSINGKVVSSGYILVENDKVALSEADKKAAIDIEIIYEDEDILVINKPAGITVHPAPGEDDVTISEIFSDKYKGRKEGDRDTIVHRLDKGTSGVMVLVKNEISRDFLLKQFESRKVTKKYITLASGRVAPKEGVIDMPLARDLSSRNRIAPAEEGKDAKTLYKVVRYYNGYTLINANPKTGRTHQIRVHFAAIGHPLYGDTRYGVDKINDRIFLHAAELSFIHPTTGKRVKYSSDLPIELKDILGKLSIE